MKASIEVKARVNKNGKVIESIEGIKDVKNRKAPG
jgi:hypothetical protein